MQAAHPDRGGDADAFREGLARLDARLRSAERAVSTGGAGSPPPRPVIVQRPRGLLGWLRWARTRRSARLARRARLR